MTTNYAAESHAELDMVCKDHPGYAPRLDALTWDQRHNIVLSVEAEAVAFMNNEAEGKPNFFASLAEAMESALEGALTHEESE